jgi:hypothetical protein
VHEGNRNGLTLNPASVLLFKHPDPEAFLSAVGIRSACHYVTMFVDYLVWRYRSAANCEALTCHARFHSYVMRC